MVDDAAVAYYPPLTLVFVLCFQSGLSVQQCSWWE